MVSRIRHRDSGWVTQLASTSVSYSGSIGMRNNLLWRVCSSMRRAKVSWITHALPSVSREAWVVGQDCKDWIGYWAGIGHRAHHLPHLDFLHKAQHAAAPCGAS